MLYAFKLADKTPFFGLNVVLIMHLPSRFLVLSCTTNYVEYKQSCTLQCNLRISYIKGKNQTLQSSMHAKALKLKHQHCIFNTHTHTYTHTHTHTQIMYAHTYTHTYTHAHTHAHTHTRTHTCMHVHIHTYVHTHV